MTKKTVSITTPARYTYTDVLHTVERLESSLYAMEKAAIDTATAATADSTGSTYAKKAAFSTLTRNAAAARAAAARIARVRSMAASATLTAAVKKPKAFVKCDFSWEEIAADTSGEHILDLCKMVTYCAAKKAVSREGSAAQWAIYYAARRGEWTQHDLSDMLSAASLVAWQTVTAKPEDLSKKAAILEKAVSMLMHLHPTVDYCQVSRICANAKKHGVTVSRDVNENKRRITLCKIMYNAVTKKSVDDLIHAVFMGVNHYLTGERAIRLSSTVSIASLDADAAFYAESIADPHSAIDDLFGGSCADAVRLEKRSAVLAAYAALQNVLSKSQLETLALLTKGYTVSQVAYRRDMCDSTVCDHIAAIRSAFTRLLLCDDSATYAAIGGCVVISQEDETASRAAAKAADKKTAAYAAVQKIRDQIPQEVRVATLQSVEEALKDTEKAMYALMRRGDSLRQIATAVSTGKSTVGRLQKSITTALLDGLDRCGVSYDHRVRPTLEKLPFSTIMTIFC